MSDAPLRILIVEDSASDAKLLERELQRGGLHYSSLRVETEPEFIAALDIKPDVVLCDWNLPQFNSLHALLLLQDRWPQTPFILVSGSIGEEAAVNIIKLGASDYLLKDRLARLVPAIEQAIAKREVKASARRNAADLELSERQLSEAQRLARLGSWTWDSVTGRVWWSDALYKLYGFEPGAVLPSCDAFLERVHLDDRSIARRRLEAMLAGEDGYPVDLRIVTADGRMIWVHSRVQTSRDSAGQLIRMEGTDQDITERKKSEQALREERDRLTSLAATAPGVLFSFRQTPDGKVTLPYSAPAVIDMFGHSPEELARDAEPIFRIVHPADLERVWQSISESASTLEPWCTSFRVAVHAPCGRSDGF